MDIGWIVVGAILLFLVVRQVLIIRTRISGDEAREHVEQGALLVDVRTKMEWDQDHIDSALCLPVQELPRRMAELPKEKTLVVYCRSGARSHRAARMLRGAGYTVHDLGPRAAW
jgi:phage shock protein E